MEHGITHSELKRALKKGRFDTAPNAKAEIINFLEAFPPVILTQDEWARMKADFAGVEGESP